MPDPVAPISGPAEPARVRDELRVTVIEPSRGISLRLQDIWAYRELLYLLIWRDIKVRYKQTVLGAAWAVIQPFMTMVVFSVVFGALARIPSNDIPYPIFSYCGLLPWMYFANSLSQASNSLVENQRLITKVYFPRLLLPLRSVVSGLVDFGISFLVLIGMMVYYSRFPSSNALWAVPVLILLAAATALAVGLWLSALNVLYRDVRYTLGFLVQLWLFVTPVAYPSSLVPEPWQVWLGMNPMTGVVEGFRWALLGGPAPGALLWVSVGAVSVLLVGGLAFFRRMERVFADVI